MNSIFIYSLGQIGIKGWLLCHRCMLARSDAGANAIALDGLNLQIDTARCDGCSLCTYVCPSHVLELREVA